MVANPYTMVPQALEKTRLTLRDIMQDYVGTKIQESKHKLALAELDVESKGLELRGKREEMRLGIDLARLESGEQFRGKQLEEMRRSREAGEQFREKQLAEVTRSREATERISELKAQALLDQQDRVKKQQALLDKEDTYGNWIMGSAILDPDLKKAMERHTPKEEWARIYSGREMQEKRDLLKSKHPRFFFGNSMARATRRLKEVAAKISDPELSIKEKEEMFQNQYLPISRDLEAFKMVIGDSKGVTAKDKKHIEEQALKMVEAGIAPTYEEAYQKLMATRNAFWGDKSSEEDIRRSLGMIEAKISGKAAGKLSFQLPEKDEKRFMDKINEIERKYGPEKANRAMQAFIRRTPKSEDLEHGFKLLDTVLREKQGKKKALKEDLSISPEEHVPPAASKEDLDKISMQMRTLTPADKFRIEKDAKKIKKLNPDITDQRARVQAELDFIKKEKVITIVGPKFFKKRSGESKKSLKAIREEHKRKAQQTPQLRTLFQ